MRWILIIWASEALLALGLGENAVDEANSLSFPGYHLCTWNKTRIVSFLVVHSVPHTVTKPCGGWLLWTTCTITLYTMKHQVEYKAVKEQVTRCCDGYEQVGRYCSLSVNRSDEFTAKPGCCPTADGLSPGSVRCDFDLDCPGWQKCCQRWGQFLCTDPTRPEQDLRCQGSLWNATVTVKMDYQLLLSRENGLLNLTRLLQAMITGALESEASIFYLDSWPVHPYRISTSLLILSNSSLSLSSVTAKLHLLLKHIPEVSAVTVQADVDECVHPALHRCSLQADCNNTLGSYQCVSRQEYLQDDADSPHMNCAGDSGVRTTTRPPLVNSTFSWTVNSTQDPSGDGTMSGFVSFETSVAPSLTNSSSVAYNSSHASLGTSSAPVTSMNSAASSPLPAPACRPPNIRGLWSANVSGTSMSVFWSAHPQSNQTFQITLRKTSDVTELWETNMTMMEMRGLQPGELYNVTVTPCACGRQGSTVHMMVKTDAQTLDASTRLTNVEFSEDLRNSSSLAYKNLSETFIQEIHQSLSPALKAMVDSGQVRIKIQSFSLGSVVVNFSMIFNQSPDQAMGNVSSALVRSLMNSSRFVVDASSITMNDFDECTSGQNDCSVWATCTNTWASYTCICLDGFTDNNPERPGRNCQANDTVDTTSAPGVSTTSPTTHAPTPAQPATTSKTTNLIFATITNASNIAIPAVTAKNISSTTTAPTTVYTAPAIMGTAQTSNMSPTLVVNVPAMPSAALTNTPTSTLIPAIPLNHSITPAAPITANVTANTTHTTPFSRVISSDALLTTSATEVGTSLTTQSTALRSAANYSLTGALSVHCRVAAITVTLAKAFLMNANIQEGALYLGMPGCGVNGANATHVQLTVAWDECATGLVHNETAYTASVTLFNTMDPYTAEGGAVEVPRIRLEVPVMCTYMKSMLVSADFGSMGYDMIKDVVAGLGLFQVTVQLMSGAAPLPHNYSLSPEQAVVVEVSLNSTSEHMKVVINKCWATPTPNPVDSNSYTFLESSCPLNMYTEVLMNGNSTTSRASVRIFSFVNLKVVYLHCQVQFCVQTGSDTCVPNCLQRTARTGNTFGTSFGSSGPILKSDEESLEETFDTIHIVGFSCLGVGLFLFLIVGFLCVFYCQRNRIGNYNFNVQPKQENFTYLVYDT
ncbi:uromodulin-like 1 [Fundulus heteroclitus]|uniref:uromodulin-like 1 n=1 Tax=Fundulus heteroclitus TaxID=8078 RepID=UPI00165ACC18|nr:uromodulin-like 1 [Fundulus heteroclitus]